MSDDVIKDLVQETKLKLKEIRFVSLWARFDSISKAAKEAGIPVSTAHSWTKRDDVVKAYERARLMIVEAAPDAGELYGRVAAMTKACVADYFTDQGGFVGFDNLTEAQKLNLKSFERKETQYGTNIKIEIWDVLKAAELTGRPIGLFATPELDENLSGYTDEELEELIESERKAQASHGVGNGSFNA